MTMNEVPTPWGNILKSNSNGTYFGLSIENVNRNNGGFVDFEKLAGLDGIAMVNIVANPAEAALTGRKALQTRITHNDGMLCLMGIFHLLLTVACYIRRHLEAACTPFGGFAGSEVPLYISGISCFFANRCSTVLFCGV
jgi:hypothetical protein